MSGMRTTLTLDSDVAALLREEAQRTGLPFKQVVNQAIRRGLHVGRPPEDRQRFTVKPFRLGPLRSGIDPDKLGQFLDQLEVEEFVRGQQRERSDA